MGQVCEDTVRMTLGYKKKGGQEDEERSNSDKVYLKKGAVMKPDPLPIRCVHIDCRAQMLCFDQILLIFEDLARWGYNAVLLEYENRFPFQGKFRTLVNEDHLTLRQIKELRKKANSLGIQIIPLLQCLGHLQYVLTHKEFRHLAERGNLPIILKHPTLCPSRKNATRLFQEMATQILNAHPDCRYFHMGGDEAPIREDCPRCGPRIHKEGVSSIFADHLIACAKWLRRQGPDALIWDDMMLAYPDAISRMRGHVIVVNWDYWSVKKPADSARVRGARHKDFRKPETWPKVIRDTFASYILTDDKKHARPFPYVEFWRDQGFPTIVASAARSSKDSFCVPEAYHTDNVITAARIASKNNVLGSIVTSWAIHRTPWPLTEYSLIAGGMTMTDPAVNRKAINLRFAEEHFGDPNPVFAKLPALLGSPVIGLLKSHSNFDMETFSWKGINYEERKKMVAESPGLYHKQLATLRRNLAKAAPILASARPRATRQQERTRFWKWALETLTHFVESGSLLTEIKQDKAFLKKCARRAEALADDTYVLFEQWYTPDTLKEEIHDRFSVQLDFLEKQEIE